MLRSLCLFVAIIAAIAPVYWMLTISFKTEVDQFASPPLWFAFTPTLEHYYDAFVTRAFGEYLLTSAIVASTSTLLALVIGTLAAYALARFELPFKLNRRLSLWILSTRMFPAIVTAVPLFLMMRGFFADLPRDLEEAALVDGDSRLGALLRVVLPLVSPGLAATAVFCLIVSWNEFLFALVMTQTDAAMTLPVGIAGRVTQYEIKWGVMSAAASVAIVPILVFALALQKYLVRGLSMGAVKG
jgi:multiple sugar transport system permease protein